MTARILAITDLHGNSAALDRILHAAGDVDLILLGGDITNFGSAADAEALAAQAGRAKMPVLAIAGNCDSPDIDRRLVELGISLHGRGVQCRGLALQGLSAMPPWRRGMHQFSEAELAAALDAGYRQIAGYVEASRELPHVVLSHCPPHGSKVDRILFGRHVGSHALRDFIERRTPALVVCGHIHEARGLDQIGRSMVVNCGAARSGSFALVEFVEGQQAPRVELCQA